MLMERSSGEALKRLTLKKTVVVIGRGDGFEVELSCGFGDWWRRGDESNHLTMSSQPTDIRAAALRTPSERENSLRARTLQW
jgi:hypothetical protein